MSHKSFDCFMNTSRIFLSVSLLACASLKAQYINTTDYDRTGNAQYGIPGLPYHVVSGTPLTLDNSGNLSTNGSSAYAIYLRSDISDGIAQSITFTNTAGLLKTAGVDSNAINLINYGSSSCAINVFLNGGSIETYGGNSHGLYLLNNGSGGKITVVSDINITINDPTTSASYGIYAEQSLSSIGDVEITNSGNISTLGTQSQFSTGIRARVNGSGNITVTHKNGAVASLITTNAIQSYGIYASSGSGNVLLDISAGVTTNGANAHAVFTSTSGNTDITNSGVITTGGSTSRGIYIQTTADVSVKNLAGGSISSFSSGIEIAALTGTNNTNVITNDGSIASGRYGINVLNGTNINISNSGDITGALRGINIETFSVAGTVINNSGNITGNGTGESGISVSAVNGISVTNNAGATIKGSTGITVNAGSSGSINNFGTIQGTGGTAIRMNSTGVNIILNTGSNILGNVVTSVAAGSITLNGTGISSSQFTTDATAGAGFQSLTMSGTSWRLNGGVTLNSLATASNAINVQSGVLILNASIMGGTGGATVASGATLQIGTGGNTGMLGTGGRNISNSGTLIFNRSDTITYSGSITGNGTFEQRGPGTVIITSGSSIAGGTTISNGVLQIGNGGAFGQITGSIVNNSQLVFSRSGIYQTTNVISGTGSLTQASAGTLQIRATNSYSGGTFLNAGIVNIASNANLGSNAGGITFNGGTLQLNNDLTINAGRAITMGVAGGSIDTQTYATELQQNITGSGSLKKLGSGTLTLTGASGYVGGTVVQAGKLIVNNMSGSATGSGNVIVGFGAALAGAGNIAGNVSVDGSIIAGVDTLTIGSGVTVNDGGKYSWTLNGNTENSGTLIIQQNNLTLDLGSLVEINFGAAVDFSDSFWQGSNTWLLTSMLNGSLDAADLDILSFTDNSFAPYGVFSLRHGMDNGQEQLYLDWAVIPEPSSYAVLFALLSLGFVFTRRNRK